ncbi:MAG: hypothetical protein RIR53_15 [Bacteroidota bacterium]
MNPNATPLFERSKKWRDEMVALRELTLEAGIDEEVKWYQPCYTLDGKNVCIIGTLNDCCVLSFFKGALLTDPDGVLELPGPNTQAGRVLRIRSTEDVTRLSPQIRRFLREAIEAERSGRVIPKLSIDQREIPSELEEQFEAVEGLRGAFESLTPGRRRAYLLHFSSAKQSSTRRARIERATPDIFAGKGLNDV